MLYEYDFNNPESKISLESEHTIALLIEQVKTLNQELFEQAQVAKLYLQELEDSNHELSILEQDLQNTLALKLANFHQAKQIAKNLLKHQYSPRESLAKLLSNIYNYPVIPEELEEDTLILKTPFPANRLPKSSNGFNEFLSLLHQLRCQLKELNLKSSDFKSKALKNLELRQVNQVTSPKKT